MKSPIGQASFPNRTPRLPFRFPMLKAKGNPQTHTHIRERVHTLQCAERAPRSCEPTATEHFNVTKAYRDRKSQLARQFTLCSICTREQTRPTQPGSHVYHQVVVGNHNRPPRPQLSSIRQTRVGPRQIRRGQRVAEESRSLETLEITTPTGAPFTT